METTLTSQGVRTLRELQSCNDVSKSVSTSTFQPLDDLRIDSQGTSVGVSTSVLVGTSSEDDDDYRHQRTLGWILSTIRDACENLRYPGISGSYIQYLTHGNE